jgi:hypothetical protein
MEWLREWIVAKSFVAVVLVVTRERSGDKRGIP